MPIESEGSGCTLAWIFSGGGNTYGATAAHCVSGTGAPVNLATNLHSPIERIGQVAFMGNADEPGRDYAFIRIDADDLGDVNPALKGHRNIPTGLTKLREGQPDPVLGPWDRLQPHGADPGTADGGAERHRRRRARRSRRGHSWRLGRPVGNVTDGNTAFGIVNTVGVGANTDALTVVTAGEGGANLDFVLQDAASRGFSVTLRTVGG